MEDDEKRTFLTSLNLSFYKEEMKGETSMSDKDVAEAYKTISLL